jgi:hypothetical protein
MCVSVEPQLTQLEHNAVFVLIHANQPLVAAALPLLLPLVSTDSKLLLTACDDMHANLYDVHQGALIDAFSGATGHVFVLFSLSKPLSVQA